MTEEMTNLKKEELPLFTTLKTLCQKGIYSFHALPISSLGGSDILPGGSSITGLNLESTVTGERFDNFFFPGNVIFKSQNLTAKTYNSDASFYITSGTSVANQIAISAICEKNDTVLVDKNRHQSVHFHTQSLGANQL